MANVLTLRGRQIITGALLQAASGPGHTIASWIAWGTGAGTSSSYDITMFTEVVAEARVGGTATQQTTTNTNDTFQVQGTKTAASVETITNFGLFDLSTVPPQTTLTTVGGINATVTSMTVASAVGFPGSGNYYVQIESEIVQITAGQGTTTWTIVRGQLGTTAATHAQNVEVNGDSGNMLVKADFTGVALNASDSITFTARLNFT